MTIQVFWSYRIEDDQGDEGRITALARAIALEYSALTGEEIELFLDLDKIGWGDNWRDRVDQAVASAAFFVPVLTPRYFGSDNCRDEYTSFVSKARIIGNLDRVLPLMYIDYTNVPGLASDHLASDLLGVQYKDVSGCRWMDVGSQEFRAVVHDIAADIVRLGTVDMPRGITETKPDLAVSVDGQSGDRERGLLDLVAAAEEAMPKMVESLEQITHGLESIGDVAASRAPSIAQAQSASAKLAEAALLAAEFESGATRIDDGANAFSGYVLTIDAGVRAILSWPIDQTDETETRARAEFTAEISVLRENSGVARSQLADFRNSIESIQGYSNALTVVLRKVDGSITRFIDSARIIDGWT